MAATALTEEQQALRESLAVMPPDVIEWLNELVYGDPGAGKTHHLGTAADHPDTSPLLIFDVEGGLTTIRKRMDVDTIPVRNMTDLRQGFNKLYHSIKIDPVTDKPGIYYKTVGIDSLSELANLEMKTIMQAAFSARPDKVEIEVPSQREWGICRERVRDIVRAFRDLPCNVIYTASVGTLQEEGQPTKYFPGFAGKLRTDIPGFMDIVGYLYSENVGNEVVRKMQFQSTRRVVAKDRTDVLGPLLLNPTVPMMWDLIQGNVVAPELPVTPITPDVDNSSSTSEVEGEKSDE